MATYADLAALRSNAGWTPLVDKIIVACVIKAQKIAVSTSPAAAALTWAKATLADPKSQADQVIYYVIAANSSATTAQILSADDATIQTNVDAAVDKLLGV